MHYSRILWDFNGTILNDVQTGIVCINRLLSRRGLPTVKNTEQYRAAFCFPITRYYNNVGLTFETEPFSDLAVEWVNEYNRESPKAGLCPGVRELNSWFRRRNIAQTVFSATEIHMLERQLTELGILELFDDFTGLDNIHAAGKIELARAYLRDKDPKTCLFLGDTEHDAQTAQAVGADCILIAGGHQNRRTLEQCGCPVADSLLDVPKLLER